MEGFYHLRIHTEGLGDLAQFSAFLQKHNNVALMVKEFGKLEKEHLHIYLKPHSTKSTMMQQIVKAYPLIKGNKAYSCRSVTETPENMVKYFCKGENENTLPVVLANNGAFDVIESHKQYWLTNKMLKQSSGVNMGCQNDPPKKAKTLSWTEKVYLQLQQDYSKEISDIQEYYANPLKKTDYELTVYNSARRNIFCFIMKCFGKTVKKINANIIKDTFDGFINSICQEDKNAGENYSNKLFDSLILNK